jgi:transposase
VLGGTTGALVIDGYTGYNTVISVDGRMRIGCHAHVRRYFFDALATAPTEGRKALDFILGLYRVEHDALAEGILGSAEHLERRKARAGPVREAFKAWLEAQRPLHPPKSPLGQAITYTINQWPHLGHFLNDVRIPLDNNESEAALRRVAMGRKNFLFVGNDQAGENLAGLYSLVATCEANGVNPIEYLEDVLMRVSTQPKNKIDELLPHRWRGPPGAVAIAG